MRLTVSVVGLLACMLISLVAGGCSYRLADLTVVSTKNVYAEGADLTKLPQRQGVEAKDVGFLGIGANIEDAVDKALEKGQGNLMIDAVVYQWSAPFVGGYKVRGTIINVPYTRPEAPVTSPATMKSKAVQ